MKFPCLLQAKALPDFQLWVRFQDNTEAVIDFREQITFPVMRSIATPEAFARVRVAETGSYCYWDVDVPTTERPDASSDWLYLQTVPAELREEFETRLTEGEDWQNAAETLLGGLHSVVIVALLLVMLVGTGRVYGQTNVLDSLQNALKTAREDTNKVNLLCELSSKTNANNPKQALVYADSAMSLATKILYEEGKANAFIRQATSYFRLSHYLETTNQANKAAEIYQKLGNNRGYAQALNILGNTRRNQGFYDDALRLHFQALKIREILNDRDGQAISLNNIANAYRSQQNYSKAREYYRRCMEIDIEQKNVQGIAIGTKHIGNTLRKQGYNDSALMYLNRAITLAQTINHLPTISESLQYIGEIYSANKNYDSAIVFFQRAMLIEEQLGQKVEVDGIMVQMARTLYLKKQYPKALQYIEYALRLADSIGNRPNKSEALHTAADIYKSLNNYPRSVEMLEQYIVLRDSLNNETSTRQAAQLESRYEVEKKEREVQLLKKDAENQALVRNSLLGGLSLVGVLVFVLIMSNNRRKKANTLLQEQGIQIQFANTTLQQKNIEITEAHTETQRLLTNVNDSIRYAKRIQDAMLPSTETLNRLLPEHFIFFRPKDVVSGDFYWCREVRGLVFVAAVDCTGHGVPGAFMSLIGNSLLNDITQRQLDPHPDTILNELHHELQTVLRQKETNNDDGMDICLCMIDLSTRSIEFSGAMNPLYSVVEGELREFKGTPEELGGREERSPVYERHTLDLSDVPEGASMLYLTTDGYKDQYNDARQRFMPKRLRPLLTEIAGKLLDEQPRLLGAAIDAHRGDVMQVDDMLVLGVRL